MRTGTALAVMLVALLASPVAAQTIGEYAISFNPTCILDGGPTGIAAGGDGNLWFTERFGNKIGRIAPTGVNPVITEF